jgi:hypothetical protein
VNEFQHRIAEQVSGLHRESRPSISRPPENANGPGVPEAVARTDKSVPRQGHPHYRDSAATNQVTLRRVAPRPANPPLSENANGLESRSRSGKIENQFPAKVTPLLSKQSGSKSSYFKEGRTLPREPSTVPERHPPSRGMDLEGFEPSPVPWQGTVLPLHHRPTNQSLLQFAEGFGPQPCIY